MLIPNQCKIKNKTLTSARMTAIVVYDWNTGCFSNGRNLNVVLPRHCPVPHAGIYDGESTRITISISYDTWLLRVPFCFQTSSVTEIVEGVKG